MVMREVRKEVDNLKALRHPHVVKIFGTYQDTARHILHSHLLMYPVGEGSLESFFLATAHCGRSGDTPGLERHRGTLKKWFGCLASAVAYMHHNRVHHGDIKPRNIIYLNRQIYFTDFSSSRRFDIGESTSTWSPAQATKLFQSPETCLDTDIQKHGSKADVFSLGLVFMEMLTILSGKDISEFHQLLGEIDKTFPGNRQYWRVAGQFHECFEKWEIFGSKPEQLFRLCVKRMLMHNKDARPSAKEVHGRLMERHVWGYFLHCPCEQNLGEPHEKPH
ncbi:kinase-like protein [Amniculicola lignicola CBS 123094]|uniref:Kinase-like protein n=1 Tax=Amniculicola lignicola CBS 123094 TaxID=1392246 RepID=A0A6A5X4G4_9PLEO|nr:kinase-like protein [Amniculicola lignicola CBS 123094]